MTEEAGNWKLVPAKATEEWARKWGTSGNRRYPWGHAARDIDDMLRTAPSGPDLQATISRLTAALQALLTDPPPTLDEPDTDAEVIVKMREIAREALGTNSVSDADGGGRA